MSESNQSLRRNGPLGSANGDGTVQNIPTEAKPHPENQMATNEPGKKHMAPNPPKDNLGARGHGGAD